jgi:pyoverdine/dityrosine biosynthesis protein Dit1
MPSVITEPAPLETTTQYTVHVKESVTVSQLNGNTNGTDTDDAAQKILDIIYEYRLHKSIDAHDKWNAGTPKFLKVISEFTKNKQVLRMCIPAFPFKSANKVVKVLGTLPDKAEERALEWLERMCRKIDQVYAPGAKLLIISDGLVYNDLLTIPDREVWNYGETLRLMAQQKGFDHLEFSRLKDLAHVPNLPEKLEEITYVANATNFRRALLNQFGNP